MAQYCNCCFLTDIIKISDVRGQIIFRLIESATICLSLVEVIVWAGHKVWMEVADKFC